MGDGYGPLVIEKHRTPNAEHRTSNEEERERLRNCLIAVPGTMTSAFLALKLYLGEFNYVVVPFDQIFEAVRSGRADAGLIIHEGQLTYAHSGFAKLVDLGEWWKNRTGLPLPLGGNVLRRDIPLEIQSELSAILRQSIEFGLAHRAEASAALDAVCARHGQRSRVEIYRHVCERVHPRLWRVGREAIRRFLREARERGYVDREVSIDFVK
mgnify:CR=1 FL=1